MNVSLILYSAVIFNSKMDYSKILELRSPEFNILECQNPEFKILERYNLVFTFILNS